MKCPVCGELAVLDYRPFCSRGHRDRDLLAWFDEGYRIPGKPLDKNDEPGLDTAPERD